MSFSAKINALLKENGMTKAALAKKSGIPYTTLDSMLKRDSDGARIDIVFRIASVLGVSVEQLVYGEKALRAMARCRFCSSVLPEDARKCPNCGAAVRIAPIMNWRCTFACIASRACLYGS